MQAHEKINYVELPAKDIEATKKFFTDIFNWSFEDYGPDYAAFSNAGLDGGFYKADVASSSANGGALVVFYSKELEVTQEKIAKGGGYRAGYFFISWRQAFSFY